MWINSNTLMQDPPGQTKPKDISKDKTKKIPYQAFLAMEEWVDDYISTNNKNPTKIYTNTLKKEYVKWDAWVDIHTRFWVYYTTYGTYPKNTKVCDSPTYNLSKIKYPKAPKTSTETTIYVGSPALTVTTIPEIYTGESAPFYECSLSFESQQADTATFNSPNYYSDGSKIRITGKHQPFGGVITERKSTQDGYEYKCIDHTMKLFGKWRMAKYNKKVSDIMKEMLMQVGLPTNGIKTTYTRHPKLVIVDEKRINIAHQLANLEGMEFNVNQDGIPILQYIPTQKTGYILYTDEAATQYEVNFNASDIVTVIRVFGKDGKYLYRYDKSNLILKYGYIDEIIDDDNITHKSDAKTKAKEVINENAKVQYTGKIVIPDIIDVKKDEWLVFVPGGNTSKATKRYIQSVKITNTPDNKETEINFVDTQPPDPSEWIYEDPGTDESCNNSEAGDAKALRSGVFRRSTGCSSDSYSNFYYTETDGICPQPGCKGNRVVFDTWKSFTWNGVYYKNPCSGSQADGGYTCLDCDADYDGVSGYDSAGSCGSRITIRNKKKVSGPVRPATGGMPCGSSKESVKKKLAQLLSGTSTSTCTSKVTTGSGTVLGYVPSNVNSPVLIRKWVDANIKYEFYYNSKWPSATDALRAANVLKRGSANCYDQSALVLTLLKTYGYSTAKRVCGKVCGGYSHCNVEVQINGAWKVIDTTCSNLNQV